MELIRLNASHMAALWRLHIAYKTAIGEDEPSETDLLRLSEAVESGKILFFGAFDDEKLIGCCSVTVGFSTYNYRASGVFEDFYILPEYRHRGVARMLARYAFEQSGVSSLTVGCADCDKAMYASLGFSVGLGNLLAYDPDID